MENTAPSLLYTCGDVALWRNTLEAYEGVLKMKANKERKDKKDKDLVVLDSWYQKELPKILKGREKRFLNLEELCQLMKWKLTRGKFRPRLADLVKTNDEATVETTSRKAFDGLPDVSSAIRELSKLKAVGPATASAILAAGAPDLVPFMADEAMMAIPDMGEISYNLPFYMKFVNKVATAEDELKKKDPEGQWTMHKVELALWTEFMAKKYNIPIVTTASSSKTRKTDCESAANEKVKSKAGRKRKALVMQESVEAQPRRRTRKKA